MNARAARIERRDAPVPRRFLVLGRPFAVLLAALVAIAACTTTGDRDGQTPDQTVKQELVVGAPEDFSILKPKPEANVATGYGSANAPVFETLVVMAPDFTIHPLLATSWEFQPPRTWRFELREGVTFHNGEPFDADAVVYTVNELWARQDTNILGVGTDSATKVDDFTVEIAPEQPNYRLVEQLVHPLYAIVAPGTYPGPGTSEENTPTGTGPFEFATYRQGKELVVRRFEGYWGTKPRLEQITFRFMPDDNSRVLALRAGEVDAIYDVPREQASDLDQDPEIQIVRSGVGAYDALLLNHRSERPYDILSDAKVRQAIAYGIDKETIVRNVWRGNAEVMQTVIPAPVLGDHATMVEGYPFDQDRAEALLEEAGWTTGGEGIRTKGGRRLELTLFVVDPDEQRPMPELVKAQLEEIGIEVKINAPGDPAIYFDKLAQGEGDMFAEVGNQNDGNPIFLGALFTAEPGGFADYDKVFGAGEEYDSLFTRAFTSPDTEEVRRLAAEAMHIAVDEVVAAVPIAGIYRIWGLSENVRGFEAHPSNVNQKWASVHLVG